MSKHFQHGFSFIEMMLAMTVGSVILAATFASYTIVQRQYNRVSSFGEVQEAGMPTIRFIERDIRMAGRTVLDADMEPANGVIATPITIVDSGDACCDEITLIYDYDEDTRWRVRYYTDIRNDPTRNAIYMDRDVWNDVDLVWDSEVSAALVVDYVEDLQFEGSDLDDDGNPRMIDMSFVLRSKRELPDAITYTKPTYNAGNYDFTTTDNYRRGDFNATINIRNLR
jgi:prepilin-type N-terminal cleavage/methylation domain-containing protein